MKNKHDHVDISDIFLIMGWFSIGTVFSSCIFIEYINIKNHNVSFIIWCSNVLPARPPRYFALHWASSIWKMIEKFEMSRMCTFLHVFAQFCTVIVQKHAKTWWWISICSANVLGEYKWAPKPYNMHGFKKVKGFWLEHDKSSKNVQKREKPCIFSTSENLK